MGSARCGDIKRYFIHRKSAQGTPVTGSVLGDFTITARHAGQAVVLTASIEEEVGGGLYLFKVTMPATVGSLCINIKAASGSDIIDGGEINEELELHDIDSVRTLMVQAPSDAGAISADDVDVGDLVEGDAFQSQTYEVPAALLDRYGQVDGQNFDLRAAVKLTPGGTAYPITCVWVDDTAQPPTYKWSWSAWDADWNISPATEQERDLFIDVQLIGKTSTPVAGIILTPGRFVAHAKWEREERTS